MIATPSVPPTSRVVSLTAEPAPAFARGSAPMMASVAGPVVNASPAAISAIAVTTGPQYGALVEVDAATRKPPLISSSPNPTTSFVPTRFITIIATGATPILDDPEALLERVTADH